MELLLRQGLRQENCFGCQGAYFMGFFFFLYRTKSYLFQWVFVEYFVRAYSRVEEEFPTLSFI